MVNLARRNMLHDKLRFAITASGVAFAVALVLSQIGLFLGLLDNATIAIRHLGADLWVTSRNTPNVDFAHAFPDSRVERVRSVPGVARADNLIVSFMNVALPSGAEDSCEVYALEDFKAWNFPWDIASGDTDTLRRGNYVFLDASAEKRFGTFLIGDYREFLRNRLQIAGVTRHAKSFTTTPMAFMDFRLAQRVSPQGLSARTSYILVRIEPGADGEAVRAEIRRRLPYNDVYTADEWARRSRNYWIKNTGLGFNMAVTVFLGCLVGVVVVALTLYTSTMEHLKEFGTIKAIGGGNGDIYRVLAEQAGIAAVVGYVAGFTPMLAARAFLVDRAGIQLILTPQLILIVFLGTVALCLGSALLSFHKVAGIDPALVFRT